VSIKDTKEVGDGHRSSLNSAPNVPATGELRYRYPCWSSNKMLEFHRDCQKVSLHLSFGEMKGCLETGARASIQTLVHSQLPAAKACDSSFAPELAFPKTRP